MIDWDGEHLPDELRKLPPGRYMVESVDQPEALTPEEEQGLIDAIRSLDAGQAIPLEDVLRTLKRSQGE